MANKDHGDHVDTQKNHGALVSHHEPDEHAAHFPIIPENSSLDKLYDMLAPLTWVGMAIFAVFMFIGHPAEVVTTENEPASKMELPTTQAPATPNAPGPASENEASGSQSAK